jgi:hypothetical protein
VKRGVSTGAVFLALAIGACGGQTADDSGNGTAAGTAGEASGLAGTAGATHDASAGGGAAGTIGGSAGAGGTDTLPQSCNGKVELPRRPIDIVLAADTSSTMDSEIPALERALNPFVERLTTAGVDPRLIVLAAHPGAAGPGLCAPAPLGSGSCASPGSDTKPPRFFHHGAAVVGSDDALNVVHAWFPEYRGYLRTFTPKMLLIVSDGNATAPPYGSADAFIPAFSALAPELLGRWSFSAFHAFDECPGARAAGDVFNRIAIERGGTSFEGNLCTAPADELFLSFADHLITASPLACAWDKPEPPPVPPDGRVFDRAKFFMLLEGEEGTVQMLRHVGDASGCDPSFLGWYGGGPSDPHHVYLCPHTCVSLRFGGVRVVVSFGCF